MKWAILVSMLCCLAWIGAVFGEEVAANETAENETSYIFIQEGTGGSFVKEELGSNYTLTITGVVPYTVYFSDRPARDTPGLRR